MAAFSPLQNATSTYRFTVGTSTTPVTLPARPGTMRIYNATPANVVYIEIGGATALVPVAGGATGSIPLGGGIMLLEKGNATQVSLIASGAATDVYITLGAGEDGVW